MGCIYEKSIKYADDLSAPIRAMTIARKESVLAMLRQLSTNHLN